MGIPKEQLVELMTSSQTQLYAFIGTLVVDRADAEDVLQETNLALWQLSDQFEEGTSFLAWACKIAYYRVLRQRTAAKQLRLKLKDCLADLMVVEALDDNQLENLVSLEQFEAHKRALAICLAGLSERNRDLFNQYYVNNRSLAEVGATVGRNANAMSQLFHRLRIALRKCIIQRLAAAHA